MYILIVRNNNNMKAVEASLYLGTYLSSQSLDYGVIDSDSIIDEESLRKVRLDYEPDLAVVLGGDGTILNTACLLRGMDTPILGINFGHLGFLANSDEGGVINAVAAALCGDVVTERRMSLIVDVLYEDEEVGRILEEDKAEEGEPRRFFALNEFVLSRGSMGKIVDFALTISGSPIAQMRGDGIIVATATGSTAYSLSGGGPIVSPEFQGLIAVPLAPHTLLSRAIVTEKNEIVEITLIKEQFMHEAALFVDGRQLTFEKPISKIVVRKGEKPTSLLRYAGDPFYARVSEVFFGGSKKD